MHVCLHHFSKQHSDILSCISSYNLKIDAEIKLVMWYIKPVTIVMLCLISNVLLTLVADGALWPASLWPYTECQLKVHSINQAIFMILFKVQLICHWMFLNWCEIILCCIICDIHPMLWYVLKQIVIKSYHMAHQTQLQTTGVRTFDIIVTHDDILEIYSDDTWCWWPS